MEHSQESQPHVANNSVTCTSYTSIKSGTRTRMSIRRKQGATLSFHDVGFEVTERAGPCCCGQKQTKAILQNINGVFRPGMNAIMGPSGGGKTSLLNLLAGRKDPTQISGQVLINGQKQPRNFRCISGYVTQDDVIMGTLTVRENLMFSAALRLPSTVSQSQKEAKVQEVIEDLGLERCADSKVGTPLIRGISGGERKRTSIGMELITSPKVLFLDEPTTGLDAHTAHGVMELLHDLSRQGQTVIFSIHQPRYSIYKLFDTLMLLQLGQVTYHGPCEEALEYFADLGYVCEAHNNPPDFFLDVLSGTKGTRALAPMPSLGVLNESQDDIDLGSSPCGTPNLAFEASNKDLSCMVSMDNGDVVIGVEEQQLASTPSLAHQYTLSEQNAMVMKELEAIQRRSISVLAEGVHDDTRPETVTYATSFPTQLAIVSKRALLNLFRNPAFSILQVSVMLVISLIVGTLYYNVDDTTIGIQNRVGAFFFITMNMIFANLSAIESFISQRVLFLHEKTNGFYRTSAFFFAKFFCDVIPNRSIPIIIYATISYWMIGLRPEVDHFFIYMLNLIVTSLASISLCFTISATVSLFAIANLSVTLIYIIMMIFGGLLVNLSTMPVWLSWLKYLSIYRYSLVALQINEMKGKLFCPDDVDPSNGTAVSDCITGDAFLETQGIAHDTNWDLWRNEVALIVMTMIFMLLSYIQLRRIKMRA